MIDHLRSVLVRLQKEGATVEETCPELPDLERTYHTLRGVDMATAARRLPETVRRHFKPTLADNMAAGRQLTMDDVADANLGRTVIFNSMAGFFERFDVLACPTVGCMPHPQAAEWVTEIGGTRLNGYMDWLRFAFLATTTGLPAISVPVGPGPRGLPVGIQLIGKPRGEAALLAAAAVFETVAGGPASPIDPVRRLGTLHRQPVAQGGETCQPVPVIIEIIRGEPGAEGSVTSGPFAVENRKPGRVAIMPLDHRGLPEDAFEGESQPRRGGHRRVQIVAFPFIAPIAPVGEHLAHHQVHRLGGRRASLQRWREVDMANFDHPVRRIDAKIASCRPGGRMRGRLWRRRAGPRQDSFRQGMR